MAVKPTTLLMTNTFYAGAFTIMLLIALPSFVLAQNENAGQLAGTVLNVSGELASDAEVRVAGSGLLTRVNDNGQFQFENLPSGNYVLEITSTRWGLGVYEVTVSQGEKTEIELTVLPQVNLREIVVYSNPLVVTRSGAVQSVDALDHQELLDATDQSLGETLSSRPGLQSTYFGPGASRPIIRGVGENRVSILQQGMALADVADLSPDHAPTIEPLLADRIEIFRGTSSLLYGSSAVGGVVNVIDGRIPIEKPTRPIEGTFTGRYSSVSEGRTGALKLRGAAGNIAWTVSGALRETNNFSVPEGSIIAEEHDDHKEGEHDDHGDDEHHDEENESEHLDHIENSNISLGRGSAGISYIASRGYVGAAVSWHTTEYGLPGHHHHHHEEHGDDEHEDDEHEEDEHGEEEEEAAVRVDMNKMAVDLEGLWRLNTPIAQSLRMNLSVSDYTHDEVEGEIRGTTYDANSVDGRLELDHKFSPVRGTVGLQIERREVDIVGAEAFMPGSTTNRFALFILERLESNSTSAEAGVRYERAAISPLTGPDRDFSGLSGSIGLNYSPSDLTSFSLNVARSTKLPTPPELYADGLHVGTQTYERGDLSLDVESVTSLEATARLNHKLLNASLTAFRNDYSNFIFLQNTDEVIEDFPVFQIGQVAALFNGVEAEVEVDPFFNADNGGNQHLTLRLWGDYTHATLTDRDEPLPRIPPFRFGAKISYGLRALALSADVLSVSSQTRVGSFEEETDGYTMFGASVSYNLFAGGTSHLISLQGRNLGNSIARAHTSYVKEMVPLPGRNIRLTYRLIF